MRSEHTSSGCRTYLAVPTLNSTNDEHSIRQVDMDDNLRIWRNFKMGKLFDLIMLDTRNYDRSITTLNWNDDYVADLKDDAGRSLMGSLQENWFYNQLSKSHERGATWRIIGNQIIFSRILMLTGCLILFGFTRLRTTNLQVLALSASNLPARQSPPVVMVLEDLLQTRAIVLQPSYATTASCSGPRVTTEDTTSYSSHLRSSTHSTMVGCCIVRLFNDSSCMLTLYRLSICSISKSFRH